MNNKTIYCYLDDYYRGQHLWIAKFPSKHDTENAGAWEMVAHDLVWTWQRLRLCP